MKTEYELLKAIFTRILGEDDDMEETSYGDGNTCLTLRLYGEYVDFNFDKNGRAVSCCLAI